MTVRSLETAMFAPDEIRLRSTMLVVLLSLMGAPSATAVSVSLQEGTVLRFASQEEAASLLGSPDPWVEDFGPFDLHLRMGSEAPVTQGQFLEFAASQALSWEKPAVEVMTSTVDSVRTLLTQLDLRLPLPDEVLLIRTTGEEEGGADYTRSHAIILVDRELWSTEDVLPLFLHELFHVMTRHDPRIRDPLYRLIGFEPCAPLEYPPSLRARKITNPDAFHFEHTIEITVGDQPLRAMMLTLARTETYTGGGLFDHVTIPFLAVQSVDGTTQAVESEDGPVLYSVEEVDGFFQQIGGNTQYIIHPEEIMANNFAFAIAGKQDLPNPEIPGSVLKVLAAASE